jgi:hypothetical protein
VVFFDFRIGELAAMRLELIECAFLVRSHQPRVARHIGGKDRGETAFDGLSHGFSSRSDNSTTAAAATEQLSALGEAGWRPGGRAQDAGTADAADNTAEKQTKRRPRSQKPAVFAVFCSENTARGKFVRDRADRDTRPTSKQLRSALLLPY